MRVLGIDGGLAHLGWAVGVKQPQYHRPEIVAAGVIETVKNPEVTVSASHTERARELHDQLLDVIEKYKPDEICAEAFSPPRDSRNACMLAWSWGVITSLAARFNLPLQAKSPMPLKGALTGNRTAKKPEMIAAARRIYPESVNTFPMRTDLHEHLADAIAAIHFFHGPHA